MMKYTALNLLFVLLCTAIGTRGGSRVAKLPVAAGLALAMIAAQLALLMVR